MVQWPQLRHPFQSIKQSKERIDLLVSGFLHLIENFQVITNIDIVQIAEFRKTISAKRKISWAPLFSLACAWSCSFFFFVVACKTWLDLMGFHPGIVWSIRGGLGWILLNPLTCDREVVNPKRNPEMSSSPEQLGGGTCVRADWKSSPVPMKWV